MYLFFETTPGVEPGPQCSKNNESQPLDHVAFNRVIVCTPLDMPENYFLGVKLHNK